MKKTAPQLHTHTSGARQFISAAATMTELRSFMHSFIVDPKNKEIPKGTDVIKRAKEIGLRIPHFIEHAKVTYLGKGDDHSHTPIKKRRHFQVCFRVIIEADDNFGHMHYDIEYCIDCTEVDLEGDWTCFESLSAFSN